MKRHHVTRATSRFILIALLTALGWFSSPAQAATFTVNSTLDLVDTTPGDGVCSAAGGVCTLRAAIMEANALPGADTIMLPAGTYNLSIPGRLEDNGATGDLNINAALTITGAGAATTIIDGGGLDRVFKVGIFSGSAPTFTASISGVTVRNGDVAPSNDRGGGIQVVSPATLDMSDSIVTGNHAGQGGGAFITARSPVALNLTRVTVSNNTSDFGSGGIETDDGGNITLDNCTITGNSSPAGDGAIRIRSSGQTLSVSNSNISNNTGQTTGGIFFAGTTLTITNSTISGNVSQFDTGGIHIQGGTAAITGSTISGNSAVGVGGGIRLFLAGALTLVNSTISGNSATASGGGLWFSSPTAHTITNSTISGNSAPVGAGIRVDNVGVALTLGNTIVANSTGGANCSMTAGATITSGNNNLEDTNTCSFTQPNDLVNQNPTLGPLASNGGPTQTHALLAGSIAIDAANNANCPATDQRGVVRPQPLGGLCDIGAFEFQQVAVADLLLTKTDAPDPVNVGANLTYTHTVTNNGPGAAAFVVLTDTLPANVIFVSATPSTGTCAHAAGVVTCDLGTLANAATATVTIIVTPATAAAGTMLTNSSSVATSSSDPDLANNSASATTTVNPAADMAVAITDAPDPVNVGANVTYSATVSNAGPSNATGVSLANTLPANVAFVSATPSQGNCGAPVAAVVTCNLGAVNNGASATVAFVVTPNAAAVPTITDSATVSAAEFDPVAANNNASQSTTVDPVADLSVTKTDTPDPVNVGSNVTYSITVANAGPSAATAVNLADTLPAGLTFVSATPSAGSCSGTTTVTCNLGTINSGASATASIVATATAAAAASVSNTATATSTVTDPNAANNSATTTTAVTPIANIGVAITDAPDPVTQNSNITYTVVVSNAGPSAAAAVTATTALPANTTFVSATATAGTCTLASGTITCTIGTLASGASVTATVIVTATAAGTVNATVNVATTTTDPTPANNSASAATTVNAASATTDFNLAVTPASQTVVVGQSANLTATATPTTAGATFSNTVVFTCATQQAAVVCANPTVAAPGGSTTAVATFQLFAIASANVVPPGPQAPQLPPPRIPWPLLGLWTLSALLTVTGLAGRKAVAEASRHQRRWGYCYSLGLALFAISLVMSQAACGNGANGVPRGPVTIIITATSGTISHTATATVVLP